MQIIVMIIIIIILVIKLFRAHTNVPSTVFCVKLTYIAILRYRGAVEEGAVEICAFVL